MERDELEGGIVPVSLVEQAALVYERNRILMDAGGDAPTRPLEDVGEYYRGKVSAGLLERGSHNNWYLTDDGQQRMRDDSGIQHYTLSLELLAEADMEDEEEAETPSDYDEEDEESPGWDIEEHDQERHELTEGFLASVKEAGRLSKTQVKVAEWIASGGELSHMEYANRLADALGCSPSTARDHLRATVKKLRDNWAIEPSERVRSKLESHRAGQAAYAYSPRSNRMLQGRNRVSPEDAQEGYAGYEETKHLDSDWSETPSTVNGGPAPLDIDQGYERQRRKYFESRGWQRPEVHLPARTERAWRSL